jgi:hypothetical protein
VVFVLVCCYGGCCVYVGVLMLLVGELFVVVVVWFWGVLVVFVWGFVVGVYGGCVYVE